jgi:hypothetical protein
VAGGVIAAIVIIALNLWRFADRPRYEPIQIPKPPVFHPPIFIPQPDVDPNPFAGPDAPAGRQMQPWVHPGRIPLPDIIDPDLPDEIKRQLFGPDAVPDGNVAPKDRPGVPRNQAERPKRP